MSSIDGEVGRLVAASVPGARVLEVRPLDEDRADDDTRKGAGYGRPMRVRLATPDGERSFVFHVQRADGFGHDRRADRAAEQLEAFDAFGRIPRHARALDVGAIATDGRLVSLKDTGELYLVTEWVEGAPYAEDLRRIARAARLEPLDERRADALADYLAELHVREPAGAGARYRRSVRDLLGSGEGILGMIDAYPPDTPAAPPERLRAIEERCHHWRWRLRAHEARLSRSHGDFHPFNVVFQEGESFRLLDASRGCAGDPADDVTAMAINFVFFALDHPGAWPGALAALFHRFFRRYLERTGDGELFEVAAPFFAWRALVVASPVFYPSLPARARDTMLRFCERALDAPRFEPRFADELFA